MVKKNIKNWDNKTWLSSKRYIQSFNNFLIKNIKINSNSKILNLELILKFLIKKLLNALI